MAKSVVLFAWATPAFFSESPVDHTWVTNFDNRLHDYPDANAVAAAGADYWFCWGSYHGKGGTPARPTGFLGKQAGNLALATCLVQANADSATVPAARGTIFVYGVDGVCHQLANQTLYATGAGAPQLTVSKARGYAASTFLYGTYGNQDAAWSGNLASCARRARAAPVGTAMKMSKLPDEFERHAREKLGEKDAALLRPLLALKSEARAARAKTLLRGAPPSAAALNAANQQMLDKAAALLGPAKFKRIFGFPAGQKIRLVDPAMIPKK